MEYLNILDKMGLLWKLVSNNYLFIAILAISMTVFIINRLKLINNKKLLNRIQNYNDDVLNDLLKIAKVAQINSSLVENYRCSELIRMTSNELKKRGKL